MFELETWPDQDAHRRSPEGLIRIPESSCPPRAAGLPRGSTTSLGGGQILPGIRMRDVLADLLLATYCEILIRVRDTTTLGGAGMIQEANGTGIDLQGGED